MILPIKRGNVTMRDVSRVPVAIKWRLAAVMADREIDNQKLHILTGLHLGTISKLRNKKPSRLDTQTLDILCKALRCEPGDLLRYMPDNEGDQELNTDQRRVDQLKQEEKSTDDTSLSRSQRDRSFMSVISEGLESA